MKRRAESDKQLQSHFEGEIRTLQERTAMSISETQNALKSGMDSIAARIQDLHTLLK